MPITLYQISQKKPKPSPRFELFDSADGGTRTPTPEGTRT